MARVPISAFVITRNEELKIADCLASLSWVHEIVVVDDFSSDRTAEICRQAGVRLIQHQFTGFRDQKSYAMSLTSHDWVLELDADERVSEEMRQSIEALTEDDFARHSSFSFPRITRFWGKWIRHSSLYPDRKERLYHKPSGAWSDQNIHERFITKGSVGRLVGNILHEQDLDLSTYLQRTIRYAELSALELYLRGRRAKWHQLAIRPLYTALYRYVIRLGFLDGVQGVVVAAMGGIGTFVKYGRLWEQSRQATVKASLDKGT